MKCPLTESAPPSAETPTSPRSLNGGGLRHSPTPTRFRKIPGTIGTVGPSPSTNPPSLETFPSASPPKAASLVCDAVGSSSTALPSQRSVFTSSLHVRYGAPSSSGAAHGATACPP